MAEKPRASSAWIGRAMRTRAPAALLDATAASQSRVLPIPATPPNISAAGPWASRDIHRFTSESSRSRPTTANVSRARTYAFSPVDPRVQVSGFP